MDVLFHLYKRLKGYDPGITFEIVREKQEKEAELRSQSSWYCEGPRLVASE